MTRNRGIALGVVAWVASACSSAPSESARSTASAIGSDVCSSGSESSTVTISCPAGNVVSQVVFASYGTPQGSCGAYTASACDATTSKSIVEATCLGKSSCSVDANNGVFGDPCFGTTKSLAIDVQCGPSDGGSPPPPPSAGDACATARESSSATVTCPAGETISSIVFASYGTPNGTCGSFSASSCNASNSLGIVQAACVGKASCTVAANNAVFGDPCYGIGKSLAIEAQCSGQNPPPPPPSGGKVYLGEYPGAGPCSYPAIEQCVAWYEQMVNKKMAIVHGFSGFEMGWDDWFSRVINNGHTLMLTINPSGTIPDILAGKYDADLQRWGQQIAANGHGPVFVRYMHEMNLPNNGAGWMATTYGAADYIAAFRRVHDQLIAGGGKNILHVWAPNVFWGSADASNPVWFKPYYPGDAYVDWVALDGYPMSESDTFQNQYGPSVALLESMTSKPIMISEYGVVELSAGWKASWFTDFFNVQLPMHPQIQAVVYQEGTDGGTDHRLETSPSAISAFAAGISASRYVSNYP